MTRMMMRHGRAGVRAPGCMLMAAALSGVLATPSAAQMVSISETHALRADATVELEVVVHGLVVESWSRNEIEVTGSYDPEVEELEVDAGNGSFRLSLEPVRRRGYEGRYEPGELRVRVPAGVTLSAETVSGGIGASGLSGGVRAESVSGGIEVSGNVTSLEVSSVSGALAYEGDTRSVEMASVSGAVRFAGRAREVDVESVSGALRVEGSAEDVDVESVSGRIVIASDVPVRSLDVETVSGTIDFTGALADGGSIRASSFSGSVDLALTSAPSARVELETTSGGVRADLAGVAPAGERNLFGGQAMEFVVGGGAGTIQASSFSGSVTIRER